MSSSDFSEPVHFSKDENGMLETETIPEENGVTKGETKHLNSETTTKATMESEPVQESDNLLISDTIQVSTPCDLEYSEHDSGNYEMDQNVANGDSVVTTNTESIDIDHEIANTYSENACETSGDQQVDVSSHASSQQHQLDVIYTEEQPKTDMTFVPSGLQEPHIYHHTHDPTPYNHDTDHSQTQTHPQVGVFVGTMGPNGNQPDADQIASPDHSHPLPATQGPHPGVHSHAHYCPNQVPSETGTGTPSPNPAPPLGNGSHTQGHQHVVHVHVVPGETFTVKVNDQLQHIRDSLAAWEHGSCLLKNMAAGGLGIFNQVFRRKKLVIRLANAGGLAGWLAGGLAGWLAGWRAGGTSLKLSDVLLRRQVVTSKAQYNITAYMNREYILNVSE
ncbi:hypothetical protein DPMN_039904 [Dreissena polymorpha]|uniref:Uncharacterized protein n=1 Tax=Dreissena polymorpha TaxID=45954 RepID=A0A9D4CWT7_DREPO|nr:hypothetical protein DPMN_039904 [Dreissena polymorpha]